MSLQDYLNKRPHQKKHESVSIEKLEALVQKRTAAAERIHEALQGISGLDWLDEEILSLIVSIDRENTHVFDAWVAKGIVHRLALTIRGETITLYALEKEFSDAITHYGEYPTPENFIAVQKFFL